MIQKLKLVSVIIKEMAKTYTFKDLLRIIFIMLPLLGSYWILQPFILLQNVIIEKYNELDTKYKHEMKTRLLK